MKNKSCFALCLVISILSFSFLGAITVDYSIKECLDKDDEYFELDQSILNDGINIDKVVKLMNEIDVTSSSSEQVYIALRSAYQLITEKLNLAMKTRSKGGDVSLIHKEIDKIKEVVNHKHSLINAKFGLKSQITELLGNFAYFDPSLGTNTALTFHYKAYCLGQRTDSVKLKIGLDFMVMFCSNFKDTDISTHTLRKKYSFRGEKKVPDQVDQKRWQMMANYFYAKCKDKNKLMNDLFFSWWIKEHYHANFDSKEFKIGTSIVFNQMLRSNLDQLLDIEKIQELKNKQEEMVAIKENKKNVFLQRLNELSEFEYGPNELEKIERILNNLQPYKKELLEHEDIPNLDKIKKAFNSNGESVIINLYYKYAVKKNFMDILESIDKNVNLQKDSRFNFLKFLCLNKTGGAISHQMDALDDILLVDPTNYRARHLKLDLQLKLEKSKITNEEKNGR